MVGGQEFLLLPVEEMERLLTSDDVNVPDEETVVTSLLTWVGHDGATRQRHLPLLLAHIRLPLLQPQVRAAKNLYIILTYYTYQTVKTAFSKVTLISIFIYYKMKGCERILS